MDHFTQLNLQGKSGEKSPNSGKAGQPNASTFQSSSTSGKKTGSNDLDPKKMNGSQKIAAVLASFVCSGLLTAALLETSGCSQSKPAASIAAPAESIVPAAATTASFTPSPAPQPVAEKASKKAPRRKIAVAGYKNSDYGLSFRYPTYDTLKEGDAAQMQWDAVGPVAMNFVQPGGTTLSTVQMPDDMFPNTDYDTGFLTASVNSKLTEEQCSQFAFSNTGKDGKPLSPRQVKLGNTEFTEVEALAGDSKQAEAKYYHTYRDGACYEFTMGLQTVPANDADGATPLERNQVFARLRWILKTLDINPAAKPTVAAAAAPATATGELMKPETPSGAQPATSTPSSGEKPAAVPTSPEAAQPAVAPSAPTTAQPADSSAAPVKVIDDRY